MILGCMTQHGEKKYCNYCLGNPDNSDSVLSCENYRETNDRILFVVY